MRREWTFEDCKRFANENASCFLATLDNDQPRVRGMHLLFCDDRGFYFTTGRFKSMYGQMQQNPKVEVCFLSHKEAKSMRVEGVVEFITDAKKKREIFREVGWLKDVVGSDDNEQWTPFRIRKGRAYFWTMDVNLEKPVYINFDLHGR